VPPEPYACKACPAGFRNVQPGQRLPAIALKPQKRVRQAQTKALVEFARDLSLMRRRSWGARCPAENRASNGCRTQCPRHGCFHEHGNAMRARAVRRIHGNEVINLLVYRIRESRLSAAP